MDNKSFSRFIYYFHDRPLIPDFLFSASTLESALRGSHYLVHQLVDHHNKHFYYSLENLNRTIQQTEDLINRNQVQIDSLNSIIGRTNAQLLTDRKYLNYLTHQTPIAKNDIKNARSKFQGIKSNGHTNELFYMQSMLGIQQNRIFDLNREMNEISLRAQDWEKQMDEMKTLQIQLKNQNETIRTNLETYKSIQKNMRNSQILIPVAQRIHSQNATGIFFMFALLGLLVTICVVFVYERKNWFISSRT